MNGAIRNGSLKSMRRMMMMSEYTYKDVIIDPEDPRVEIGKECYSAIVPNDVLDFANRNEELAKLIEVDCSIRYPFHIKSDCCDCWTCLLIRKKEPEKKYVPLDLNDREDVFNLMGGWLMNKTSGNYHCVITIKPAKNLVYIDGFGEISPEELLEGFKFVYDESPCGKLKEVTDGN